MCISRNYSDWFLWKWEWNLRSWNLRSFPEFTQCRMTVSYRSFGTTYLSIPSHEKQPISSLVSWFGVSNFKFLWKARSTFRNDICNRDKSLVQIQRSTISYLHRWYVAIFEDMFTRPDNSWLKWVGKISHVALAEQIQSAWSSCSGLFYYAFSIEMYVALY